MLECVAPDFAARDSREKRTSGERRYAGRVLEEDLLPFPERIRPLRHVRSTLLLASLQSLRDAHHFDRYVNALSPAHRDVLLGAVAGVWIDVAHAAAHYEACTRLGLSPESQVELGRGTFVRTKVTILGTSVRLAQNAGVTPWTVLPHFQRFWSRGLDGGAIRIARLGPKDAQMDLKSCSLVDIDYFRNGLRGLVTGMMELFCRKAYLRERPARASATVSFRAQWA